MKIDTWRDPYDAGFSSTRPKQIDIKPGLTVLVGCNGAGKTTLIKNIEAHCVKNNVPCLRYDNLTDGGHNALSAALYHNRLDDCAMLCSASEGEAIKFNIGAISDSFREFIEDGHDLRTRHFDDIFSDKKHISPCTDERVILFDAIDSGLSIDSIVEIKLLFNNVLDECSHLGKVVYIVAAANGFELPRDSDCFDVNAGKYTRFSNYEDYRKFIITSRQRKEKRIQTQEKWIERQKQKELIEYSEVKKRQQNRLSKLASRKEKGEYVSSIEEYDAEKMAEDFLRRARFISIEDVETTEITERENKS